MQGQKKIKSSRLIYQITQIKRQKSIKVASN